MDFEPRMEGRRTKYVATVPDFLDLWQDPQERYNIFMNNYTERTWTMVSISAAIKDLIKTTCSIRHVSRKARLIQGRSLSHSTSGSNTFATCWRRRASTSQCRPVTDFQKTLVAPLMPRPFR